MKYFPCSIAALTLSLCLAWQSVALADVKMPAIFGDHMVLQQDLTVPVWGTAEPGESVTVTVGGKSANTTAGKDGKWQVKLPSLADNGQPATMTVAGKNTLTFQDVLIGEVWVCSGQSNMAFPLRNAHNSQTELPKANDPQLRLFQVANKTAHTPAPDVTGKWVLCTPETATNFTAVGYFFGRELREKLNRPVGLIETCWGGTPAEAWTSLEGLEKEPVLAHYVDQWKKLDANYAQAMAAYPAAQQAYVPVLKAWTDQYGKDYDAALAQWRTASATAAAAKQTPPPRPMPPVPKPVPPLDPNGGPGGPAALYDGMVAPLEPYAIRGAIWYQGEANAGKADEYRALFPEMIKDWREKWGEGDFPFLFVQLAGWGRDDFGWPKLRDAQLQTLSLPNTGMATAVDIGLPDNIHPMDKLDVGKRLALAARHVAYGENLVYSGPIFQSVTKAGPALRVEFHDTGSGLEIGQAPWVGPTATALPTDHLVGFELAGADGKWSPADAKIDGDAVIVTSAAVAAPAAVRYDWKGYPEGNLYNKEGLPASPFQGKVQ